MIAKRKAICFLSCPVFAPVPTPQKRARLSERFDLSFFYNPQLKYFHKSHCCDNFFQHWEEGVKNCLFPLLSSFCTASCATEKGKIVKLFDLSFFYNISTSEHFIFVKKPNIRRLCKTWKKLPQVKIKGYHIIDEIRVKVRH